MSDHNPDHGATGGTAEPLGDSAGGPLSEKSEPGGTELEPVMVVLRFQTDQPEQLSTILANYVVLSRGHPGCRNVDFVSSATTPGRLMVVEKWDSAAHQRVHFDSPEMVDMAKACDGLLTAPPDIDLYDGVSMHDTA
ncbi:MAG: antibiotic biosynthesis monooxygenase [Acidimicrobiia bacterium]|nr:antibiotic biosynthesis monooxygenase [Acidimicrobiia bacterium]